jgi:hypothetical protein
MTGHEIGRANNIVYIKFGDKEVAFCEIFGKQWAVNKGAHYDEDAFIRVIKEDMNADL